MSVLYPPPQTRIIGYAQAQGKRLPVEIDIAWFRYLSQELYERAGGALGPSTSDLAVSQFDDAGITELYALTYANQDANNQGAEVAALREELQTLRKRMEALEQGVSL